MLNKNNFFQSIQKIMWLWRKQVFPAGVDIGNNVVKIAQFRRNGNTVSLASGASENRPVTIASASSEWQKWAMEAVKKMTSNGKFIGREVIAAMPANEVFIDHLKITAAESGKLDAAVFAKVKKKLPFEPDDAVIKCIPCDEDNVMVIAVPRAKIDRHLAIYEKANLHIKSIGVWPLA